MNLQSAFKIFLRRKFTADVGSESNLYSETRASLGPENLTVGSEANIPIRDVIVTADVGSKNKKPQTSVISFFMKEHYKV